MSKQPEALRLADRLEMPETTSLDLFAAAELRRQHALIAELVEALQDGLKTADFERHPFRPWHAKARLTLSKAKEQS